MGEQQDHHCILSFKNTNWRIRTVRGPFVVVETWSGRDFITATVDLSKLNVDAYAAKALKMDYARLTI